MKSSLPLKLMAAGLVCFLIIVFFHDSGESELQAVDTNPTAGNGMSTELSTTLKSLGIEADTPDETLKTLVAKMHEYESTLQESNRMNKELKSELTRYKNLEDTIVDRVNLKINKTLGKQSEELEETQSYIEGMVSDMEGLKSNYFVDGSKLSSGGDVPNGIGVNLAGDSLPDYYTPGHSAVDEIVWIEPISTNSTQGLSGSTISFPSGDKPLSENLGVSLDSMSDQQWLDPVKQETNLTPFFTIPANGTLIGSVAMTALLGRVPVDGTVTDPYPVKILIGKDNLSSNGITIPDEITGIVMSGVAKGDWNLSCASAEIKSMTFTFQDGTIRTIPDPKGGKNSGGKALGWISDKYGVPCVNGKRISNAPTYLATKVGLGGLDAFAQAMAQAETTTVTSPDGNTVSSVTGDAQKYAMNNVISGGSSEALNWMEQRMGQSFDVIYVEPGTEIVFHASQQMEIDYNDKGRMVNHYARKNTSGISPYLD